MKITSFNSLGCYDLILIIGLPLAQARKIFEECGFACRDDDNNLLLWENDGHTIEGYPNIKGTMMRLSITKTCNAVFAQAITKIAIAEDNFEPGAT